MKCKPPTKRELQYLYPVVLLLVLISFSSCSTSFQVKVLSEEASNRKAFIESLKRRLNVATTEKNQYEASCTKLKEDLEKKVGIKLLVLTQRGRKRELLQFINRDSPDFF